MLAAVPSATLLGVDGHAVRVEVHVSTGLPGFTIVGQPDTACREARDRVRAAVLSSGLDWPLKKITVNLAPSGRRKSGAGLDLAVAVGVLVADEQLPVEAVADLAFLGELGLDGVVRKVPGMLSLVDALSTSVVVLPAGAMAEARLVARHAVRPVDRLSELVDALRGAAPWPDPPPDEPPPALSPGPDLADVKGAPVARRAVEIAAAGGHHLLMVGPPGAGKSMVARRLPGLLPALERDRAFEVTRVHSAAGEPLVSGLVSRPPLRAPHHSSSLVSLVGGGAGSLRPGEISLAHGGVLFLDELGEFAPATLDALRQPLEEGLVRVSRAQASVSFPASFLLVAAMNPCPCGLGGPVGRCNCSAPARARYARRVSGPLLDRFDLRVSVARPEGRELLRGERGESSGVVAARVAGARDRARARGVERNAALTVDALDDCAPLSATAIELLESRLRDGRISARGLHRVRCVARTIADLEDADDGPVERVHLLEALGLRSLPAAWDRTPVW